MVLLLTAGIMGIALWGLARLARATGIRIKGKAFALAGVFAAAIALGIPAVAPFLTPDYYVKLAALAIAAALLVTIYNAHLYRKELRATRDGKAEKEETAESVEHTERIEHVEHADEAPVVRESTAAEAEPIEAIERTVAEEREEIDEPQTLAERTRAAIGPTHFKWERPRERLNTELVSEPASKGIETTEALSQTTPPPLGEVPSEREAERVAPSQDSLSSRENRESPTSLPSPTPAGPPPPAGEASAVEPPTPEPTPEPVPDPLDVIHAEIASLTTLDDYLGYADDAQKQGDLERATAAYASAVDVFVNDPYIIYLYMDLGNLLKQQARYADCINVYHAALSIPVLAENPAIAHEFEKNIRYLGIVQAVLRHHHAEDTPFSSIPAAIRAEIEAADQALAAKQASKDEASS